MSAARRLLLQRAAIAIALCWTGFALVAFLRASVFAGGYQSAIESSNVSGRILVSGMTPQAEAAGVKRGDEILAIDGRPVRDWGRDGGWDDLDPAGNRYEFATPDGRRYEASLAAVAASPRPIAIAWLIVGAAYLSIGILVWLLRPGRDEAWVFALFCVILPSAFFAATSATNSPAKTIRSPARSRFAGFAKACQVRSSTA